MWWRQITLCRCVCRCDRDLIQWSAPSLERVCVRLVETGPLVHLKLLHVGKVALWLWSRQTRREDVQTPSELTNQRPVAHRLDRRVRVVGLFRERVHNRIYRFTFTLHLLFLFFFVVRNQVRVLPDFVQSEKQVFWSLVMYFNTYCIWKWIICDIQVKFWYQTLLISFPLIIYFVLWQLINDQCERHKTKK